MALGENSLSNIVKTLTERLPGRYTDQSLRRSSATRLFQAGYEEDMVCRLSGHRSSAVRIYKELATHQKQAISAEIQCSSKETCEVDIKASRELDEPSSKISRLSDLFKDNTFNNIIVLSIFLCIEMLI